jgi:phosphoribosylaminoimidazole-succinocarboxamide synthase
VILTRLSLWWFERLADLAPNHVVTADVDAYPAPFTGRDDLRGRSTLVRRLDMVPVECVARAYLAGSGTVQYRETGAVSGVPLPPDLAEGSRLPEPIFTPTTKAPVGQHDEFMTFDEVVGQVGAEVAGRLRELTLTVYTRGAQVAADGGIVVADTKLEFGLDDEGRIVLADEVLTSDSSRFWPADRWAPGGPQFSYDKQYVRDWSATLDWDRTPPGPEVPPDVVAATRARYVEVYERITGLSWAAPE